MFSYINPWHVRGKDAVYGPPEYVTTIRPHKYREYLIFNRVGDVWDVVKDGRCVTQRAGINGAKQAIDEMISGAAQ